MDNSGQQKVLLSGQGGRNELNFVLPKGKSMIFRYIILIVSITLSAGSIDKLAGEWSRDQ